MNDGGLESRPSPIAGQGLFTTRAWAQGERLAPYLGQQLSAPPVVAAPGRPTYLLELHPGVWVAGDHSSNLARFANHACTPNAELIYDAPSGVAWLVAQRDLHANEEITFDYGFSLADSLFHPCHCGTVGCVGRILAAPLRLSFRRHLRFSRRRD